jgi:HSP20 family protein
MSITKYDPIRSFFAFPSWMEDADNSSRGLKVRETDKDIIATAVIAGVKPDEVDINVEDGVLTIKAQSKEEEKEKDSYKSSSFQYYYTVALSGGQWDKAEAEVEHGIVTITIPKAEAAKPRKIEVKAKNSI